MARAKKVETKTEYINVTSDEVMGVIKGLSEAIDHLTHDFGFSMNVMGQISKLLNESPPDLEMVRCMLDQFFNVYVPEPGEECDEFAADI